MLGNFRFAGIWVLWFVGLIGAGYAQDEQDGQDGQEGQEGQDGQEEKEENPITVAVEPQELEEDGYANVELLLRAIEIIRERYVDDEKISYSSLINNALAGMLDGLDPHSQFLFPELYAQVKATEGENTYEGVGIAVAPKGDALTVVSVREDGPAARAGVFPGDQIVKIGDTLSRNIRIAEAVQLLRGNPGEKLKLTVRRPANDELREIEMTREVIKEGTVKDVMLLDKIAGDGHRIGYVRLLQFDQPTAGELRDALDKLEDQGMDAFVLDLRNNPGGLITSAVDVCGEFLPPETPVATTEGRVEALNPPPYRTASRQQRERQYPVAVLVNHSSASGAEMVSGALQDLKRAVIVGETTFGKGSVQAILPIGQGTALRLTIAKYFTPGKKTIHENGIVPDIVATLTPEEEERILNWWTFPDKRGGKALAGIGDRQLQRAVDALKGMLIYRERIKEKE
jgi:carboxyl-terminal processing protease